MLSLCSVVLSTLSAESLTVKELNRIGNERHNKISKSYSDTIKEIRKHGKVISVELDKTDKPKMRLAPIGKPFDPKSVDAIRGEIKRKTPFKQHDKIKKRYESLDKVDGKPVPKKLSETIKKSVVTPVDENAKKRVNDIFKGKTITVKESVKRKRPQEDGKKGPGVWNKIKNKISTKKNNETSIDAKPNKRKGSSDKTQAKDKGINPWDVLQQKLKEIKKPTIKPAKNTIKPKKISPEEPSKKTSVWENIKKKVVPAKKKVTVTKPAKKKITVAKPAKKVEKIQNTEIKGFKIKNSVTPPSRKHTTPIKKHISPKKNLNVPKEKKSSWWNNVKPAKKTNPVKTKKYIFKKDSDTTKPTQFKGLIYKKKTVEKAPEPKKSYRAPVPPVKKKKASNARIKRGQKTTEAKVFNSYLNKFNISTKTKPIKRFKTERGSGSRTGKKVEAPKVVPQNVKPKEASKPKNSSRRKNGKEDYKASFKKLVI